MSTRVYNTSMAQDDGSMEPAWSGFYRCYWKNDSRENARRDAERETAHQLQIREQMEAMRGWMEHSGAREQERAGRARLSKLSDSEDIEAGLQACRGVCSS